ncbi:MAG TPA: hypothetical protein VF950_22780 [Planctomycetota bacterium]
MEPRRKAHPIVVGFAFLGIAAVLVGLLTTRSGSDCGPGTRTEFILQQLKLACAIYHRDYGGYPPEDAFVAVLASPPRRLLDAECVASSGQIEDAWGTPLRYRLDQQPVLSSAGPDGRFETADDIVLPRPR